MVESILKKKSLDLGNNRLQILAVLSGCLPAICTGFFQSWSSPFIMKIVNDKINYDITEEEASYFTVLPFAMILLFCPIVSRICDVIGRKQIITLAVIPHALAFILKAFARSVYIFHLARCISGIGDSIVFIAVPMYIGEICVPSIRGTWGNAFVFFIIVGNFVMNILGIYFNVAEVSYICLVIPVIFILIFPMMPESPFFYLMVNKEEEAKAALKRLRGKRDIDMDFIALRNDVARQMSESGNWKDLFAIESNRKALLAGVFVRLSQQFGGVSVFIMYINYIFDKSESNIDANMSALICSGLNMLMTFMGTFLVDRLGRKKSYMFSLAMSNVALVCLSIYFYIDQFVPEIDISFMQWVPLACIAWFIIFSALGMIVVPSLIIGELFSASIKAKGVTATVVALGFAVSLVGYLFYFLNTNLGLYSPYLFFAICNIVSIVLTTFIIPETSGKTLEEIQQSFKR